MSSLIPLSDLSPSEICLLGENVIHAARRRRRISPRTEQWLARRRRMKRTNRLSARLAA
jgi:hypothetical protein